MKFLDVPKSGSQANTTASRNRGGQYTRNRRSPVQPIGSGRRNLIRAAFASASQKWATLTDAQRAAWASVADGFPYVDSLGQTIKLTGHQFYVACATQLLNCGTPLPTAAPATTTVAAVSAASGTASVGGGTLNLGWTAAGTANGYNLVSLSPPVSPGVSYNKRFWQAATVADDLGEAEVFAAYVAEFGALVAGKRIFFKITPVNQYGVTGTAITGSLIVGA